MSDSASSRPEALEPKSVMPHHGEAFLEQNSRSGDRLAVSWFKCYLGDCLHAPLLGIFYTFPGVQQFLNGRIDEWQ